MDIFSERLKWMREKHGKTQKDVADYMGVSQQYYGRFEKGQGQPNLEAFSKLMYLFDEQLEFFLGIFHLDKHGSVLFSILSRRKEILERKQQRLQEFFDFMKNENIDDEELKKRISALLLNNRKGRGLEKDKYLKAKREFIAYAETIPGIGEVTDEYIDHLYNTRQQNNDKHELIYTKMTNELFEEYRDE